MADESKNAGNAVGLIKSANAPAKTFVIWAKILDPDNPDVTVQHVYNPDTSAWEPLLTWVQHYKGAWQADTDYLKYDIVTNGGSTYVAPADVAGVPVFDAGDWDVIAQAGADGDDGTDGVDGTGMLFSDTAGQTIAGDFAAHTVTSNMPANQYTAGDCLRILANGYINTTASPGTLNVGGIIGAANPMSGAKNVEANLVDQFFEMEFFVTIRTIGGAAAMIGQGTFRYTKGDGTVVIYGFTMTATQNVPTTGIFGAGFKVQWGQNGGLPAVADAANSLTFTNMIVEHLTV